MTACPLKFAHQIRILKPRDVISTFAPIMDCDGDKCAWWTKTQEQCAIRSMTMALWALNEKLATLPEKLTEFSP